MITIERTLSRAQHQAGRLIPRPMLFQDFSCRSVAQMAERLGGEGVVEGSALLGKQASAVNVFRDKGSHSRSVVPPPAA